ncbi:MAG: hypothetical protein H7Y17_10155 [Chlorobia bacterium]|nr:hypothetical protein [Fimbriimonadaceae bacterium]
MLPILPALLLLILQGPSSIERMALDGRLPAALEAVTRQLEGQDHRNTSVEKSDAAVLASLLAFSSDPGLSHALFQILNVDQPIDALRTIPFGADEPDSDWNLNFYADEPSAVPEEILECQRSRDGPL